MSRTSAGRRVEQARRILELEGVSIDCLDVLAIPVARAAALLSVSVSTIDREIARGNLPSIAVAGVRRISVVDLVAYLDDRRGVPARETDARSSVDELVASFGAAS